MKRKEINPIEQHIEKIVLGVVAVVFVAVVSTQLAGGPTKVTVDGQEYAPGSAYAPIEQKATRLIAEMNEARPGELPSSVPLGLVEKWVARPAAPAPGETIVALGAPSGPGSRDIGEGEDEDFEAGEFRLAEFVPPAPAAPRGTFIRNTLEPVAVRSDPVLQQIVGPGAQQPFDHTSVTLEFTFDGNAYRSMLADDPDGDGNQFAALPRDWWRENTAILEVQLERAELDEAGNPTGIVQLPQKPGHEQPIEPLRGEEPPAIEAVQAAIDMARRSLRQQLQPRYYPVLAGPRWAPPTEAAQLAEIEANRPQIERLVGQLAERRAELDEALARQGRGLQRPGGRTPPPPRRPGAPGQPQSDEPQETPEQLQSRINRLQTQVNALEVELTNLNVDAEGQPALAFFEPSEGFDVLELLEEPALRILAHDPTAQPGARYVYRARVIVNNPLYGRGASLRTDQASRAVEPWLQSAWSGWSDPIEVPPSQLYFLASASEGDQLGGPRATLEMYRFYYGYWRRTSATFEPGEPLAAEIRLPDPRIMPIWPEEYIMQLAGGATPAAQPTRTGRGLEEDRNRGSVRPTPPRRGSGRNPSGVELLTDPLEPGQEVPLPPGAEPGPESLPVSVEGLLLDVATLPGSGASRQMIALLASGERIVTQAASQTRNDLYRALQASVRQGQNQGREAFVPPEPEEPEPEPEPRFIPEEGGRGGGGGAGGG